MKKPGQLSSEELERQFADPVDVFEDRLAAKLGLSRTAGAPQEEWRRSRREFIDSFPDDDEMAAMVAAAEREIHGDEEGR